MITMSTSAVQRLYEVCRETLSPEGAVPSQPAIARLTSLLDTIRPIDVGLDVSAIMETQRSNPSTSSGPVRRRRQQSRRSGIITALPRWTPPVTYVNIHHCPAFSIAIFCLPTSAVIPLHDHLQMTVFSKILYGSMHIKAFDWLDPQPTNSHQYPSPFNLKLATLKVDSDFRAPCEPSILYPTTGGNIHSFTAITSCAVLDVFFPPYSGNPSYYRENPYPPLNPGNGNRFEEEYAHCTWLEEIEKPENFVMIAKPYRGPRIIEAT